jgi:D-methionine transport system ATP-binding protein
MPPSSQHLVLNNISKFYAGQCILENVSLSLDAGQISGIIGKSGAGKSTLIRCANFLIRPDAGQVIIDGLLLNDLSPSQLREQRRKIGMIFQHFNLLSSATVYDNIALPLKLAGKPASEIKHKVQELAELTQLGNKIKHYPAELSGGQKQRVAIARALVNNPTLLLCDEATSALDPETTDSILNLLKKINQELKLSILLITHEMEVIKNICDEVTVLDQGRVIEQTSVLKLFSQPQANISKNLIRKVLKLDLPDTIQRRLKIEKTTPTAIPVLEIKFIGNKTIDPVISELALKYRIHFSILQANIELIQDQTIGILIVEAIASEEKIRAGLHYLKEQGLQVEIIGYVHND